MRASCIMKQQQPCHGVACVVPCKETCENLALLLLYTKRGARTWVARKAWIRVTLSALLCHVQLAKRYYNAHALVDLCVSAVLDQSGSNGQSAGAQRIREVSVVVSTPTVVEKGADCMIRQCGWGGS